MSQSNIRTVVSFEVVRTLRTKIFWIGSLLGPVFFAVIIGISVASSSTAANIGAPSNFPFEWVDHSGLVDPAIATAAGGTAIADPAQGVADVAAGKVEAFFEFPADPANDPILVTAQDQGLFGSDAYPGTASAILKLSASAKVSDPVVLQLVSGQINTQLTTYKDGTVSPGPWAMVVPATLILIFFVIITMQGNRMLAATLEEKENRVTEMILTTIKPTSLLVGKVLALGIIGLVQVVVIVVPTIVVAVVLARSGRLSFDLSQLVIEPLPLVIGLLLLIGGFLLFTCSLIAIGAAMPTVKDAQGMFATVLMMLVLPVYVVIWMMTNPDNVLIQILTFFPWTAPITAMARNAIGTLPWWQGIIVSAILFVFAYLVFRVASRLFQYGSVEYSKRIDVRAALTR